MRGGDKMRDGDEIRLIGSGGAPFVTTVGRPFSVADVQRRLKSGEWSWPGDASHPSPEADEETPEAERNGPQPGEGPQGEGGPTPEPDPDRPPQSASKDAWVVYVARTLHMSREAAANYTKADLIDLVS